MKNFGPYFCFVSERALKGSVGYADQGWCVVHIRKIANVDDFFSCCWLLDFVRAAETKSREGGERCREDDERSR